MMSKPIIPTQMNGPIMEVGKRNFIITKTIVESSFNFHFRNIFKLKLWLFAVSFASLGVLVLLFNDKIKQDEY